MNQISRFFRRSNTHQIDVHLKKANARAQKLSLKAFILSLSVSALLLLAPTVFLSDTSGPKSVTTPIPGKEIGVNTGLVPYSSQAVNFAETQPLRDLKPVPLTPEEAKKREQAEEQREKNEENTQWVKRPIDPKKTGPIIDQGINNFKNKAERISAVTNPIQNFDGPDMDIIAPLFGGGRFAPPDTNMAVGPNHVVITTNSVVQVFNKTGTPLTTPIRISQLLSGIANAADDDGDPIVLYDHQADRWLVSQFNLRTTNNSIHEHIAISKTNDPTGAYYAYDYLETPGHFGDYPHLGVWPDGYYMSTNDFNLLGSAFLGAGLYVFERNKMLVGDPTAKIIGFNTDATHGGMLPTNLQGFTPPPAGTPNVFIEFDADEFGAATDLIRGFSFHADFATPANSTLTQGPDIPTLAFDARNPSGRGDIQQPTVTDGLDSIADRLMHPLNFRILPSGEQSLVLNFTVNVSGVNPTSSALYQGGIRWMELRRNAGTGAITINQQATYAPSAGNGTGRDLWMASVAQDGEGNIALAASASNSTATPTILNPTAIYTGRLAGDPTNTLPQGEIDAFSGVTKGVQTGTGNRWGDYSSLYVDPADECMFWGAFEYVDSPTASFDWNTRIFSFKVNSACVTAPRGTLSGTITNCGNGQPITNAVITTPDGFFRQTNASGQYSMIMSPGTYTVNVTAPGFSTCTQTVTISANGTATVNCCLVATTPPMIVTAGATLVSESCAPANGALDPGETVMVSFCVQNTGTIDTTNLVGTLQATGGVTNPSGPQTYGVVTGSGAPVCRNFTFTANGTCGGTITASIQFQDGATNLGTVTYTFKLGVLNTIFSENFDGVTAPALPAGWVASQGANAGGSPLWVTSSAGTPTPVSDTAPNAIFTPDPASVLDNRIDSPTITYNTTAAKLSFRQNFDLEQLSATTAYDAGVLEISINGGTFQDILTAGGSFVSGGYNHTGISTSYSNPLLPSRPNWSGNSGGFITTVVNLPAAGVGVPVKLRWRMGSDTSISYAGWRVDTVKVTDGFTCCVTCTITCPANITVSNDPNQCGAVVTYPAPTTTGACGTVTCTPASGSFFPKGTTTVTCTTTAGPSCSFTVTVVDNQPPSIICPPSISAVLPTPGATCVNVTYCNPTVSDNCSGVTFACVPPSGSCLPQGTTTVTCTATDTSSNTASCSFTITVFGICIHDDTNPNTVLLFITSGPQTGQYRFCCNGTTFTGVGIVKQIGSSYTLTHNPPDRRVQATFNIDGTSTASLQSPPGRTLCTITDKPNVGVHTCICGSPGAGCSMSGPEATK